MSDELFLEIGIGTRSRRIFEMLSAEMDKIYQAESVDISVREFPILYCILVKGPLTIADIQTLSGLSHSAVSQTVKKLITKKFLLSKTGEDARSKIITLSDQGQDLIKTLTPIWDRAKSAMITVLDECQTNILDAFADFEKAIKRKSFTQRYNETKTIKKDIQIEVIPFHVKYRDDWRYINQQWIDRYFKMEETDLIHLMTPEENILAKGGEIYFGLLDGKPVGAIALKYHGNNRYELSKMGVLPEAQGYGIGKILVQHVISRYKARGGSELFLETNSSLKPAISLYKKTGFKEVPPPENTPYVRADYFMVLDEG